MKRIFSRVLMAAMLAGMILPMLTPDASGQQAVENTGVQVAAVNQISNQLPANQPKIKVRIKDVARMSGDESYVLTGYGVVVGLAGTGDSDSSLIQRTISNIMQNFNIIVDEKDVKAKNTACVMVTATIKGKAHKGDQIEAAVSAVGDGKSLLGGQLLLTPLLGVDGEVWAIAQGTVTTGGFTFGSDGPGGNTQTKNHPTVGALSNGAKLLKDIGTSIKNKDILTYYLSSPDFTAATNLSECINAKFFGSATAVDGATVKVRVPNEYKDEERIVQFVSEIEQLYFTTDSIAKVVFNEKTGTIVIGADVRISEVAISHGNIYVNIKKFQNVTAASPFTMGTQNTVTNDQTTKADESKAKFIPVPNTTSVQEMVRVLNALGVTPRDMMMIFHALRAAGALHAQIEAL